MALKWQVREKGKAEVRRRQRLRQRKRGGAPGYKVRKTMGSAGMAGGK